MLVKSVFFTFWAYRITRCGLGLILLYSGLAKIAGTQSFSVIIGAFGLVPECMLMPIALIISILEVTTGLGLLIDLRGSLAVTTCLMVFFMAVLGYGIYMGFDIDCGCFGPTDSEAEAFHGLRFAFCRDAVIMLGIFYLYWCRVKWSVKPLSIKNTFENVLKQKGELQNANN
jgi:uncharacterized membrane protein